MVNLVDKIKEMYPNFVKSKFPPKNTKTESKELENSDLAYKLFLTSIFGSILSCMSWCGYSCSTHLVKYQLKIDNSIVTYYNESNQILKIKEPSGRGIMMVNDEDLFSNHFWINMVTRDGVKVRYDFDRNSYPNGRIRISKDNLDLTLDAILDHNKALKIANKRYNLNLKPEEVFINNPISKFEYYKEKVISEGERSLHFY